MNLHELDGWRPIVQRVVPGLSDPYWSLLKKEGWIGELARAEELADGDDKDVVIDEVLSSIRDKVADWRALQDGPPEPEERLHKSFSNALVTRTAIVSEIMANIASDDADVRAFREKHLAGELLRDEDVEAWVERRRGKPSRWIEIAIPDDSDLDLADGTFGVTPALTLSRTRRVRGTLNRRLLIYTQGGKQHYALTTADGALEVLRQISEGLSRRYTWKPDEAATFVLTGATPTLAPVRIRDVARLTLGQAGRRIILEVDPAVKADELASAYRTYRTAVLGRRHRTLSEKMLRLAAFITGRSEEESMRQSMDAWNHEWRTEHPDWAYTKQGNFNRDAREVLRRLLDADLAQTKEDDSAR